MEQTSSQKLSFDILKKAMSRTADHVYKLECEDGTTQEMEYTVGKLPGGVLDAALTQNSEQFFNIVAHGLVSPKMTVAELRIVEVEFVKAANEKILAFNHIDVKEIEKNS